MTVEGLHDTEDWSKCSIANTGKYNILKYIPIENSYLKL